MHLSSLHIQNYRLLLDVKIDLDTSLTLFVGKNNTAKTSIMHLFKQVLDKRKLLFDDYPFQCRKKLYGLLKNYYEGKIDLEEFVNEVPCTSMRMTIDYSLEHEDEYLGALSSFIIDNDFSITKAFIDAAYRVSPKVETILNEARDSFNKNSDMVEFTRNLFDSFFELHILAVNPTDEQDIQKRSQGELEKLFNLITISAERNLDESESKEKNPLNSILERLFSSDSDELDNNIRELVGTLNTEIERYSSLAQDQVNDKMEEIIESMLIFGYPGAEDLTLHTATSLSLIEQVKTNTILTYRDKTPGTEETLPSSHTGLGYKNLIKITLLLHEFKMLLKLDTTMIPLLFIEEPEAHMHPQLQTTFSKFIEEFLDNINDSKPIQIIMTTHSSHIANAIPFSQVRYMKKYKECVKCKNLVNFSESGEKDQHKDFLEKYLKLSNCDLYFCDKAILIEGASERLLLPYFITKCYEDGSFSGTQIPLSSQYYTIVEVGGTYAHRFYDFIDFLEIPTLILTDIDFVKGPQRKKCQRTDATATSNGAILHWCKEKSMIDDKGKVTIDSVLELQGKEELLVDKYRKIMFQYKEQNYHPRTLEDAIRNVNRTVFKIEDEASIPYSSNTQSKTDFALDLLMDDTYKDLKLPSYIKEGIIWLNDQPTMRSYLEGSENGNQ